MQIMKGVGKGETKFLATIECLGEDNGTKESLSPIMEKVFEENKDVMSNKLVKTIPPRSEVDHNI